MRYPKFTIPIPALWMTLWVVAIGIVVFATNPTALYFQNDDFIYIPKSPLGNYLYRTAFRPVSDLTLRADYYCYGKDGGGFHITNLLFHLLATCLVFFTIRKWQTYYSFEKTNPFIQHAAALLFLVYPFHSESVFWIVGRGGSLVTIFFLLALLSIMHERNKWYHWALSILCFIAGLFTYESSWLLPAACTITVVLHGGIRNLPSIDKRGIIAMWLLLLASFGLRWMLIRDFIGSPYLNTDHFNLQLFKQLYKYSTGLFRSFLPPMDDGRLFLLGAIVITVLIVLTVVRINRTRLHSKFVLCLSTLVLVSLSPVSLLGVNTHTSESERFLYLPSAFLCMILAILIYSIFSQLARWLVFGLLMVLSIYYYQQSASHYQLASQWNKTTLEHVGKQPGHYPQIHVFNLPAHFKGAFMFRLGFEDAVNWMCPQVTYDSMVVHSSMEVRNAKPLTISNKVPKHFADDTILRANPKNLYIIFNENELFAGQVANQDRK